MSSHGPFPVFKTSLKMASISCGVPTPSARASRVSRLMAAQILRQNYHAAIVRKMMQLCLSRLHGDVPVVDIAYRALLDMEWRKPMRLTLL
jgi:hypothetical protein